MNTQQRSYGYSGPALTGNAPKMAASDISGPILDTERIRVAESHFKPHDVVWTAAKIGRLWDYYANSRDHDTKYFGSVSGKQVATLVRRKRLLSGAGHILDLSCGKGHLITHLSSRLSRQQYISGLDFSPASVEETRLRNVDNDRFSGSYLIESWPCSLGDQTQDLILLTEVIEHMTDGEIAAALNECRRLLRPGGNLLLTTPNNEALNLEKTLCPECGCIFHRGSISRLGLSRDFRSA